uniref:YqaJ viral recombinase domain-containing protein n=1 Tax=Amphimedon queenslandica TaxID=400682 RepID=A0A1X7V240_AMPQE
GWLGASPDAWVYDPSVTDTKGIAEFKCPFREADSFIVNACSSPDFCCELVDGKLHLKEGHTYYHQVQLQLYVASDLCKWCDFCIYTKKGVAVQQIYPDKEWIQKI